MTDYSGKFVLRVTPGLHARLTESARREGISLNERCVRVLSAGESGDPGPLREVIARAQSQLGGELVAVAVFGSWARGTAGPSSDVDVLFVTAPSVEITRSLYGPWDQEAVQIDGHVVEPHFVRLPLRDEPISGLWAELAVEAAVVFDPDLVLSRELIRIRRAIVDGLLVKRESGGQSWWTAA